MRIRLLATILFTVTIAARAEAQFNVPAPASGENFHVELGLMFWPPTPRIEIQTGGLASAGFPRVDFVKEFGLANELFMEFRSVLKSGRKHKIRISHVTFEYNEQTTVQRDISFGGVTFPVTVPVTADLNWDLWRFGWEYDFVAGDRGVLGFITELKQNHLTADLSSIGFRAQSTDVTAPIIALGVILGAVLVAILISNLGGAAETPPGTGPDATASAGADVTTSATSVVSNGAPGIVPTVLGLPEEQAKAMLTTAGYTVRELRVKNSATKGEVVGQTPEPGIEWPTGRRVDIVISEGPS